MLFVTVFLIFVFKKTTFVAYLIMLYIRMF